MIRFDYSIESIAIKILPHEQLGILVEPPPNICAFDEEIRVKLPPSTCAVHKTQVTEFLCNKEFKGFFFAIKTLIGLQDLGIHFSDKLVKLHLCLKFLVKGQINEQIFSKPLSISSLSESKILNFKN